MIPVALAPAPADFDTHVKQRGLDAIAELVGEHPTRKRSGPKRKKVADRREEIPADAFPPFWRDVLPDMLAAYRRLCAYLSLYIEHATGSPSVDHVIPKSKRWDKVYEWSNYRLACALVNSHKNHVEVALDPFEISDGLFELDLVEFQVKPGAGAVGELEARVIQTICVLGLNARDCCIARQEYVEAYLADDPIPLSYLERRAPFVARELRRQGKLRHADL